MKKSIFVFLLILYVAKMSVAQEFIRLWPDGKMPNTKGLHLTDSISDERYRRVGTPGMFAFFPSRQENKGMAVVICPGGGYKHYAYLSSGTQVAKWFNTMGVSAFVLISRLPHSPDLIERSSVPLQDAQRAMRLIRANAPAWGIQPDKIGIIGFSAGGHVASTLGTHTEDLSDIGDSLGRHSFRPDFMLLVSPVITMGKYAHAGSRDNLLGDHPTPELLQKYSNELQVTEQTPPAFLVHAENDPTVNPENSLLFFSALRQKNVSVSMHIFPQGGHAIGLQNNPGSTRLWRELCVAWLIEKGFLPGGIQP
ncbi:MAG: alpha/beta hydrolase [Marinilabiliales bacterium]|nr:alpha/beta hydrolase [Marinilabiliales bacterium]